VCYFNLGDLHKAYLAITSAWMYFHFQEDALIASAQGEDEKEYPFINMVEILVSDYLPTPSTIPSGGKFADVFYSIGSKCIEHGYFEGAVVCFDLTIQDNPQHYKGYSNLGTCLLEIGKFAEGVRPLLKALEINPSDEITYFGLSVIFLSLDYPDFALPCAKKALNIRPTYDRVKNILPAINELNKISPYKSKVEGLYGSARIAGLVINPLAAKNLREANDLQLSSQGTRNSDIVRGFGAALETELRDFFLPLMSEKNSTDKSTQTNYHRDLTLGSLAMLIGDGFTNLIQNDYHPSVKKGNSAVRASLKSDYHITEDELNRFANNVGTVSILRNSAAHGESLTAQNAEQCKLHVQISLEHLMRLRLNHVLGNRYEYSKNITLVKNGQEIRLI